MRTKILNELPKTFRKPGNELLRVVAGAFANALSIFETDLKVAVEQANVMTATGWWLDFWGFYFKVDRFPIETDDNLRARIIRTARLDMVTYDGILEAIKPYVTGTPTLNEYKTAIVVNGTYDLSDYDATINRDAYIIRLVYRSLGIGTGNIHINEYYVGNHGFIKDISYENITNTIIKAIANDVKMAGIKLVFKVV